MSSPFTEAVEAIDYPDADAAHQARLRQLQLRLPAGSLGLLEELAVWSAGAQGKCPPDPFDRAQLVLFAAEHGIAVNEVSANRQGATAELLQLIAAGSAPVSAVAADVPVRVVDTSGWPVRVPSGRIDVEDAFSTRDVQTLLERGMRTADEVIDAGCDLILVDTVGVASSTPAAALIAVLTDTEPIKAVGRGSGIDDAGWIRKTAAVRDARRRAWPHRNSAEALLAVTGGADSAAITGLIVQAARRRTPVLLGGLAACAAALVAQLAAPRVVRWLAAGQLSPDAGHELAVRRLGLTPIEELGVGLDQGVGPLLALPTLRAANRLSAGTATRTD